MREPAPRVTRVLRRTVEKVDSSERLNKELKRRCRVVGIFPTEAALIRLAGAVLLDTHEEWIAAERRYFSEASMAMLYPERDDVDAVIGELEGADTD